MKKRLTILIALVVIALVVLAIVPMEAAADCGPGDANCDGKVNVLDMILIGQHWGETGEPGWIQGDVKRDGVINVLDMIMVGQNWTG